MKTMPTLGKPLRQRGQALIEYVVATAAITAVLFLPVPAGEADYQDGKPLWQFVASSFSTWYERFSYANSLPN